MDKNLYPLYIIALVFALYSLTLLSPKAFCWLIIIAPPLITIPKALLNGDRLLLTAVLVISSAFAAVYFTYPI